MNWYLAALKQYAVFDGRARRKEYWFFGLVNLLVILGLVTLDRTIGTIDREEGIGVLSGIYGLAILLPSIAVSVRRLHDTNRSGWWLLISFVPLVGGIVFFIFTVLDSTPGENHYGANPKEIAA